MDKARAEQVLATIANEIKKGESPTVTSFVGASAAPSHAPAASPHTTPNTWSDRAVVSVDVRTSVPKFQFSLPQVPKQHEAERERYGRNPKVAVRQNCLNHGASQGPS